MSVLRILIRFNKLHFGRLAIANSKINPIGNCGAAVVHSSLLSQIRNLPIRTYCEEKSEESDDQAKKIVDSAKDRSKVIPVDVSIQYLQSSAYKTTYGEDPVWTHYRRNHKGSIPPKKTRKRCIRQNQITTGNPCPICRDEYLVLHPKNINLLKQFISPHTGETLSYRTTGLCQHRHNELLVAILQAKDLGLITFDLPFHEYDYSEYVSKETLKSQ
ncbi:28S ribosomal protein S18b, mitochondrial [Macrosteles quadrilineatus]|uniref:28S ribosomal protein S18b, mitochondrial n=1 Tax=Macrosteles quadrilineatus TaxID=74068 RepID=UPI0023E3484E|nr:28S ribosomal protein S18b, mitochondrial [Macrosteles quadrilineatus]